MTYAITNRLHRPIQCWQTQEIEVLIGGHWFTTNSPDRLNTTYVPPGGSSEFFTRSLPSGAEAAKFEVGYAELQSHVILKADSLIDRVSESLHIHTQFQLRAKSQNITVEYWIDSGFGIEERFDKVLSR